MQKKKPGSGIYFILFMFALLGILLNLFIILDAEKYHFIINKQTSKKDKVTKTNLSYIESSKKSILFVAPNDCSGKQCSSGTGFVIKRGYVVTNAHVIQCSDRCENIELKDYKGKIHSAQIEAITSLSYSKSEDIAILKINDLSLPALKLANSSKYQVQHDGDEILTIGYPLPGAASSDDKASVSDKGAISTYKSDEGIFVASGMHFNSGNSGGPVILIKTGEVIGIATSVLRGDISRRTVPVEGVEYVIPINRVKNFFIEKTGDNLENF